MKKYQTSTARSYAKGDITARDLALLIFEFQRKGTLEAELSAGLGHDITVMGGSLTIPVKIAAYEAQGKYTRSSRNFHRWSVVLQALSTP